MRRLLAAGLFTAALVSTALPPTAALAAGEIGRVKTAAGTVNIVRGDPKAPLSAKAGLLLLKGDVIQTGKDGAVGITFVDNSRFAVGPNTRLALTDFEFDRTTNRGRFTTDVNKGTVAVVSGHIAKTKDAMKVRTPVSVLAARGTRFVVEVP